MTLLQTEGLGLRRGERPVLSAISFAIQRGECVGLIGPNGAGKTSLMRAALGLETASGHSTLSRLAPKERAALAAWLPQGREVAWPVSVAHLVALGAQARGRSPDHPSVHAALTRLSLHPLAERQATELSGGELARVLLARALAQDTPLLLADEPLAGLDPAQAIRVMQSLAALAKEGHGVLVALHDLGLAARFCSRVIVLDRGQIVASGAPEAVLTPALLAQVFAITAYLAQTEQGWVLAPMACLP